MKDKKIIATLSLFGASLIWGIAFIIMKTSLDSLAPALIIALRFSVATIVLSLIFIRKLKNFTIKLFLDGLWTGSFLGIAYIIQTYGLKYTTPGKNAFLTAVYCIIIPFIYWIIIKKKPTKYNIISAVLTIIGIGFVSLNLTSEGSTINFGDILTLICGVFYAFHIVYTNVIGQKYDISLFTIAQFISCSIIAWVFSLIYEGIPKGITINVLPHILFLGIFPSAIAILLQNFGLKYVNPNRGSLILSLESVFGAISSIVMGYEKDVTIVRLIGFVIVFIAIVISETELSFLKKKKE